MTCQTVIDTLMGGLFLQLTAEEKVLLETTAKQKGFQGLSDFVRAAALELAK